MKADDAELLKEFTAEQIEKLDEIIDKFKGKPGGLIPVLEEAQVALEYLPVPIQKRIANGLNLPLSRVYGVVTFYSFFTMTPRGKHTVRVCLGTACYVRGGKAIAEKLEKEFGVKEGETTPDRMFYLLRQCDALGPAAWDRWWSSTKMFMDGSNRARLKKS